MPATNLDLDKVKQQLAPDGILRVAINLSNFLLVSGKDQDGAWFGVAPDLARTMADRLEVDLQLVPYETPSAVAAAVDTGAWSVAFIGNEPARAVSIAFSPAYVEIESGYLVPPGSPLTSIDQVDQPGIRIAAYKGSAYELWLASNLRHATLVHGKNFDEAFQRFRNEGIDALASLAPQLLSDVKAWPGTRILPGRFMAVQQSMGTSRSNPEAAVFLQQFVADVKASGLVASLIEKHHADGLTVAQAS